MTPVPSLVSLFISERPDTCISSRRNGEVTVFSTSRADILPPETLTEIWGIATSGSNETGSVTNVTHPNMTNPKNAINTAIGRFIRNETIFILRQVPDGQGSRYLP